MPVLTWDKSFELGIKQFDEHHMHLVYLLNKTYDTFVGGATQAAVGVILDELIDYATYHFAAEERWMASCGYGGFLQHVKEHDTFSRRVAEIQRDFHSGKTHLSSEILIFLKEWLSEHILKTDAEYGRFIAGIPPSQS